MGTLYAFVKRHSRAGRKISACPMFGPLEPVASQVPEHAVAQDDGAVGCVVGLTSPALLRTRTEFALGSTFDAAGADV